MNNRQQQSVAGGYKLKQWAQCQLIQTPESDNKSMQIHD